jgi:sugar/nucleoside kinase (ribokinase family)
VTVDVVCAGPVFLDVTFEGLEELPGPGEERFARDLHTTPGGAAIIAVGLARLGLGAAIVAPLGRDYAGTILRDELEAAGVACAGARSGRTPVTAVLPVGGERAMATFGPPRRVEPGVIERLRPRAVVVPLDELELAPDGVAVYATVGQRELDRHAGRALPAGVERVRAVVANRDEALRLTGETGADAAALALAEAAGTGVVTCGAEGAVAAEAGELTSVPAPFVEARDTTGAGDLFVAAYVAADLAGLALAERLRRAAVYAALSVRTATGARSAATLEELERRLAELDPAIMHE